MDQVDVSQLAGTIDVAAWMEQNGLTELPEGETEMEVDVSVPNIVTQIGSVDAVVNIMADTTADQGAAGEAAAAAPDGSVSSGDN